MFRIMSENSPNAPPVHPVTHELGQLEAIKCTGNVGNILVLSEHRNMLCWVQFVANLLTNHTDTH
jgi:hypothetical protein